MPSETVGICGTYEVLYNMYNAHSCVYMANFFSAFKLSMIFIAFLVWIGRLYYFEFFFFL